MLVMSGCDGATPSGDAPVAPSPSSSLPPVTTPASVSSSAPTSSTAATRVTKVFDAEAMQKSVRTILTEEYLVEDVRSVTCPPGRRVEVDSTFECTAQIGGEPKTVPITVTSEKGDYQVGMPS